MPYLLKANITIDSRRPDLPKCRSLLTQRKEEIMNVLTFLGVAESSEFYYYHPDEEAEASGTDYVALNVSLAGKYGEFRSLVHVTQIIQSLTALFDGTSGVAYRCTIDDPLFLAADNADT